MSQLVELDPLLVNPLQRPERPSRRRRRKARAAERARPVVIKLAIAIVVVAAVASFAGRIGALALAPVMATYRTGLQIQDLRQEEVRMAAVNAQLREDIHYLKTSAGVEQEARRRGWVKPGEVSLTVVLPDDAPPPGAKPVKAAKAQADLPWSERIREAVDTCLTVLGTPRKSR